MRKLLAIVLVPLCLSGCGNDAEVIIEDAVESCVWYENEPVSAHNTETYTMSGTYYTIGEVITADGNVWEYDQDVVSGKPSYDGMSVLVYMDDSGTPDYIYDDVIINMEYDH